MNRALMRSLCLLALLVSIVVRFQANLSRETMISDFDVGAGVTEIIRKHGYSLRDNPIKPPRVLASVIYFQRQECDQPSLVLPYYINAETLPLLARLTSPGFDYHFYYLDGSWSEESRVPMFFEWVICGAGYIRHVAIFPIKKALVLADAPDCHPAEQIDWRSVWHKDTKRKVTIGTTREFRLYGNLNHGRVHSRYG